MPVPSAKQVAQHFGRAATTYDAHATLQQDVADKVAALATPYLDNARIILDAGCGSGALAARLPGSPLIGLDLSEAMCQQAFAQYRMPVLCSDATCLPLQDRCCDVYVSSLCWQWLDVAQAIRDMRRVLAPEGIAIVAMPVHGTFAELEHSMQTLGFPNRLLPLLPSDRLTGLLQSERLAILHSSQEQQRHSHPNTQQFFQSLRAIGATASDAKRPITPKELRRLMQHYDTHHADERGIYVTYQIGYWVVRHD